MATNPEVNMDTSNSSAPVGIVIELAGTVKATGLDGSVRYLSVGDTVYAEDVIETVGASRIAIDFNDGSRIAIGNDSVITLDSEVYGTSRADVAELNDSSDVSASVTSIQEAILAGVDPTEVTAAPAAGPDQGQGSEGGGGHTIVQISRTGEEVTPESGFETTGISVAFTPRPRNYSPP